MNKVAKKVLKRKLKKNNVSIGNLVKKMNAKTNLEMRKVGKYLIKINQMKKIKKMKMSSNRGMIMRKNKNNFITKFNRILLKT